jgi:trimeric autotransporter adhesin
MCKYLQLNDSNAYAGNFTGDVNVSGTLSNSGSSFKIDDPLDPADKYLHHSFVESPDMKNIYDGVAVLDARGEAVIEMPEWFSVLNRDFRYQLTAVGKPGPGLYIAEEMSGNHFSIAGGTPGAKVSWQVTGIRQDAWANAHRIPVEEEKSTRERGFYIHPELYGAPAEKQIEWARHPQVMMQIQEIRAKQLAAAQRQATPRN